MTFNIFVKVGYYPLLPLACACILVYTIVVYCIWSYMEPMHGDRVAGTKLTWT